MYTYVLGRAYILPYIVEMNHAQHVETQMRSRSFWRAQKLCFFLFRRSKVADD